MGLHQCLLLLYILDLEGAHGLRADEHLVETGVRRLLLHLPLYGLREALFPCLFHGPSEVLVHAVDALEVRLLDLDFVRRLPIHFCVQLSGKSAYIHCLGEVELDEGLLIHDVERVGEVFEPDEDLVLAQREQSVGGVGRESLAQLPREGKELLVLFVVDVVFQTPLVVKGKEVLWWLLDV